MAQAKRLVLVHVADVEIAGMLHGIGVLVLAALAQHGHKLGVRGEVLLDGLLVVAVHDNHFIGSRCQTLFHDVLDDRAVDNEQHFLRLSLRGGQETRAQASGRDDCLHMGHTFLRGNRREAPRKRRRLVDSLR